MFVMRSTHERVVRERDEARAVAEQRQFEVGMLRRVVNELDEELRRTSVRGKGGRFVSRVAS